MSVGFSPPGLGFGDWDWDWSLEIGMGTGSEIWDGDWDFGRGLVLRLLDEGVVAAGDGVRLLI